MAAAPAGRRYFAGWFATGRSTCWRRPRSRSGRRAGGVARGARPLALHEYTHLVVAANNPACRRRSTPALVRRYLRWAWLCEGAATHFAGQTRFLRPAIARRLREGRSPSFPPSARDALLLGATVFDLLEQGDGPEAAVELAGSLEPAARAPAIERAFARSCEEVERDWRDHLEGYRAP